MNEPKRQSSQNRHLAQRAKLGITGKKTEKEWRVLIAMMMGLIAQGLAEDAIIEEMGLRNLKDYNDIKKRMYDLETKKHTGRTNEQLFIDYIINQRACIEDLDEIIRKYKDSNQANALVGAIRAKSDIVDKIVKRGEELRVLRKDHTGISIVAGLDISSMTNLDIKLRIRAELQQLERITQGPIIDFVPEDDVIVVSAIPPCIDEAPARCKRVSS